MTGLIKLCTYFTYLSASGQTQSFSVYLSEMNEWMTDLSKLQKSFDSTFQKAEVQFIFSVHPCTSAVQELTTQNQVDAEQKSRNACLAVQKNAHGPPDLSAFRWMGSVHVEEANLCFPSAGGGGEETQPLSGFKLRRSSKSDLLHQLRLVHRAPPLAQDGLKGKSVAD